MHIHTGEWMGAYGSAAWVALVGGGILALALTGLFLVVTSRAKGQPRVFHRILGATILLPLAATALTGLTVHFFGNALPDGVADVLMSIHQGGWLGKTLRPFYVLLLGCGLLAMIVSGLKMARGWQRFRQLRKG